MIDLKAIFRAVSGGRRPTPDTTESATRLVNTLPTMDSRPALVEIIKAVARINKDVSVAFKDRINTLLYVDTHSAPIHHHLCLDYLAGVPRARTYLPTILAYWTELANGYLLCLRQSQNSKTPQMTPTLELAAARALHHQLSLIRWSALRYIHADGSTWLQAYRLYSLIEQAGFQQKPITLYQPDTESITPERMLIQAAMLQLAQTDNLVPIEIEAIHLMLSRLVDDVSLAPNACNSDFQYVINLDLPVAPQLLRRGTLGKGCRFWSGDAVVNRLADLILDFDQEVPANFKRALPSMAAETWRSLLQKLSTRWSQDGGKSMRRHERLTASSMAKVEVGFERIAHHLRLSRNVPPGDEQFSDEWRVTDSSEAGVGMTYLGRDVDGLLIGRTIWIGTRGQPAQLGIIRRVQRLSEGGTKVGVELLGNMPLPVQLSESINSTPFNGIYITQNNTRGGRRVFLVPNKLSSGSGVLSLSANGKTYQIRITELVASHEDCQQVEFDTLERLTS
ncbi:PilZ domain-containing protein [Vogesella facilis]|uniref:PilZ domain-containing protein n=1 Tax=Vogesella facilis TaxID=1655232 RepID=A0ABV7REJ5_9NEIS